MLYRFLRLIALPYFFLFFPTKIINKKNMKDGKAIYICNHYSVADSLIISTRLFKRYFHAVVKKEAFKNKFNNWFLKKVGMIPVDRKSPDLLAYKSIMKVLNNNESLMIYPEGTRNKRKDEVMSPLKNGAVIYALKSDSPIIPMMYYQSHKFLKLNYLMIGDSIDLSEFRNKKIDEQIKEQATEKMMQAFNKLRIDLNKYVESKH
jgi:1-acyl-sn-glycerol-3-phosphate acyltransferase